jgi:hypothetical protein
MSLAGRSRSIRILALANRLDSQWSMICAMHPDFDKALAGAQVVGTEPLKLPSGRLVAAEPPGLFGGGPVADWAFTETVAPGVYPVQVYLDGDLVIAAQVIVRAGAVAEWRPAKVASHPEWERCYFPVDGGTGSFGSVEVFESLTDDEARADLIADLSFGYHDPYTFYDDEEDNNLICFRLGGDGRFETWVGYTAAGELACFLTAYRSVADEDIRDHQDHP